MAKLSFEFNEEIIKEWEQQLGKRYKNWSNEDKKNFLLYVVTSQIPILDSCVESSYGLSSLQQTPFGQKINELIDMGFELVLMILSMLVIQVLMEQKQKKWFYFIQVVCCTMLLLYKKSVQ